jgi:hypothetical protein
MRKAPQVKNRRFIIRQQRGKRGMNHEIAAVGCWPIYLALRFGERRLRWPREGAKAAEKGIEIAGNDGCIIAYMTEQMGG